MIAFHGKKLFFPVYASNCEIKYATIMEKYFTNHLGVNPFFVAPFITNTRNGEQYSDLGQITGRGVTALSVMIFYFSRNAFVARICDKKQSLDYKQIRMSTRRDCSVTRIILLMKNIERTIHPTAASVCHGNRERIPTAINNPCMYRMVDIKSNDECSWTCNGAMSIPFSGSYLK